MLELESEDELDCDDKLENEELELLVLDVEYPNDDKLDSEE